MRSLHITEALELVNLKGAEPSDLNELVFKPAGDRFDSYSKPEYVCTGSTDIVTRKFTEAFECDGHTVVGYTVFQRYGLSDEWRNNLLAEGKTFDQVWFKRHRIHFLTQ